MKKTITLLCLLLCLSFSNTANAQEPYLGQITMFAGNFAPRGWALCEGQLLPIAQNTALFSLLGTTYGGDGRTTFALPDLRGRAPIHAGQGPASPTGAYWAEGGNYAGTANTTMANNAVQVQNAGGSIPHENRQPYIAVNYIIALQGIYPSRN